MVFMVLNDNVTYLTICDNVCFNWILKMSIICSQAKFVVKTDDDQYVDLYEGMVLSERYNNSLEYTKDRFLFCPVLRGSRISVNMTLKFYVR